MNETYKMTVEQLGKYLRIEADRIEKLHLPDLEGHYERARGVKEIPSSSLDNGSVGVKLSGECYSEINAVAPGFSLDLLVYTQRQG